MSELPNVIFLGLPEISINPIIATIRANVARLAPVVFVDSYITKILKNDAKFVTLPVTEK
jgi:hypothetical protein